MLSGEPPSRRVSNVSQLGAEKQASVGIFLEKNTGPYDAGDVIRGHVEVNLNKELRVKGMRVQFYGAAKVSLENEKTTHYKGVSIDKKCKNFELLLDHKIALLKKESNQLMPKPTAPGGRKRSIFSCTPLLEDSDAFTISAGANKYPFEFVLPRTLPSSYEGKWGTIQYGIRLTIEKSNDTERVVPFSVRGTVDLNDDLDLLKPVSTSSCVAFSRLCSCARRNLTSHLTMIKRAFLPGEAIRFIADVNNETHKKLKNVKITLVQQVTFRAGDQAKKTTNVLHVLQAGPIGSNEAKRWDQELLNLPRELIPTTVSKSIQVKYHLNVNIHIGLMDDDLNLPLPLIVGTVPFKNVAVQRHLAKLRQTDPTVQSILTEFGENAANFNHRESVSVSRQNSASQSLTVPHGDANGRRHSTGSTSSGGVSHRNHAPVKRMSSAGSKGLTVSEARRVRLSNSDLTVE